MRPFAAVTSIAAALSGALHPAVAQSVPDLVLENARIVDPSTRQVINGHLLIAGGRIVAIEREGTVPEARERVDLDGRWVIPGLVDMHVHSVGNLAPPRRFEFLGPEGTARRVLGAGVTAFLDLFYAEDAILGLRDRQRSEGLPGADIFAAGPCLTAPAGHCSEYGVPTRLVEDPDEARREVRELAAKRPDVVKLVYDHAYTAMPTVDRVTMAAVLAAAREAGIPTVVHVGTWQDAAEAAEAGASAITHLARESPISAKLAGELARRGTAVIPTLVTIADAAVLARHPEMLDEPFISAFASDSTLAAYRDSTAFPDYLKSWLVRYDTIVGRYYESMRRLRAAGVTLLVGTDAGNFGTVQGWSVHRELARFVEAGLDPWDALAAATVAPGRFLGRSWGVRVGDEANLVVLDGSPVEDIRNTAKIHLVVHHGKAVNP